MKTKILGIKQEAFKSILSLEIDTNDLSYIEDIKDCENLNLELKKPSKKRTLDANAYMWVLIGKIQAVTGIEKELIYKDLIRNIGSYEIVPVKEKAVDKFCSAWTKNGLGWVTEVSTSKLNGFKNVTCYYGSSIYNRDEMKRLIDLAIFECKELKIETMRPNELESLLSAYN